MNFRFLFALLLVGTSQGCDSPAGGTSYLLGFPENEDSDGDVHVHFASTSSAIIAYQITTPGDGSLISPIINALPANTGGVEILSTDVRMSGVAKSSNAVRVNLAGGNMVITASNNETGICDGYLALPTGVLDTEYMPIMYWPPWSAAQVLIIATEDSTTVEMTLQQNRGIAFTYESQSYQGGDVFSATMDAFEVIQILDANDLTGSLITSSNPIAVISGNKAINLNIDQVSPRGQILSQVPPISAWGESFYVVPFPGRPNTLIKVVARYENTTVKVEGDGVDFEWTAAADGDFEQENLEFAGEVYLTVIASDPVMLVQFAESATTNDATYSSAPAMLLVPAAEQWRNDHYIFEDTFTTYYLLVVVASADVGGVKIDGASDASGWTTFESSSVVGKVVSVTGSSHTVIHDDSSVLIGVSVYGSEADVCTSAYPASLCAPTLQTTAVPTTVAGDTTAAASTADATTAAASTAGATTADASTVQAALSTNDDSASTAAESSVDGSTMAVTGSSAVPASETTPVDQTTGTSSPCGCAAVFVTAPSLQKNSVGIYSLYNCLVADKQVYQHAGGSIFLYYNESSTTWVFSETLEGSDVAHIESQAGDVATPLDVTGNWLVLDGGVMVESSTVSVDCICDKTVCDEIQLTSSTPANTFPGTFEYDSDVNDRPAYVNSEHGVYLYFHSTGDCHFWAVADSLNANKWLMYAYDISPRPNEVMAAWQVATVDGWEEDSTINISCS